MNVPHLATALTGPLLALEKHILSHHVEIETWLRSEWRKTPPPFYASVDLRNAGYKIAPVDTNLFPGGFNNLNPDLIPLCVQAVQTEMSYICPDAIKVLLIPESHTRNISYYENIAALVEIFTKAGYEIRVGTLIEEITKAKEISLPSGKKVLLEPLQREGNKMGVADFYPCLILLNNDFASGVPDILQNISQKIMPPLQLGWATRLKSIHFRHYQQVTEEFSKKMKLDPWLLSPLFRNCGEVNFMTHEGEDCLVHHADELLKAMREKYQQYNITAQPYVVVKADAGTYGMAVMTIQDPEQIRHLNRKQRTQMSAAKSGKPVTKAIIQEGVYTIETHGAEDAVAEPVVYMIGPHVVGGFYRVHSQRRNDENLNAPGAQFEPLAFQTACSHPLQGGCENEANRFYLYGVIARLALVAAAREMADTKGTEK